MQCFLGGGGEKYLNKKDNSVLSEHSMDITDATENYEHCI